MKTSVIALLLILLLLGACSTAKMNQGSIMRGDYGSLKLVGDPIGRIVTLDGNVVTLDTNKKVNIFELKTGTYLLEIRSGGAVLLSQKLFITQAQTNEVKMP